MKTLTKLILAVMLATPAFAEPPTAALKANLDALATAPTYIPTGVFEGGKVKQGSSKTITLTVDPAKNTFVFGVCEGCYMFGLAASDETGKSIDSFYKTHPRPLVLIKPGQAPTGKINLEIDMTSGCEKPKCDFAVGAYHSSVGE